MNKISESGIINQDGILKVPQDRLQEFYNQNRGKRVLIQIEAVERGTSMAQMAYWYKYIVPTCQDAVCRIEGDRMNLQGYRMNERKVDIFLRERFDNRDNNGRLLEISEFSRTDFAELIDFIKQYAAEYLSVYIEDSRTI